MQRGELSGRSSPHSAAGLYPWQHRGLKGFLALPLALQQVTPLSVPASSFAVCIRSSSGQEVLLQHAPAVARTRRAAASHQHDFHPTQRRGSPGRAACRAACSVLRSARRDRTRLSSLAQPPQGCVAACPGARELLEARPGRGLAQVAPCSAELHRQPAPVGVYTASPPWDRVDNSLLLMAKQLRRQLQAEIGFG